MLKRDHNSQQHDDRDKVASTPPPLPLLSSPMARYDKCSCLPFTFTISIYCIIWHILLYIWFFTFKTQPSTEHWNNVCFSFPLPAVILFERLMIFFFTELPLCCLYCTSCPTSQVGEGGNHTTKVVPVGYYPLFCCSLDQCDYLWAK